MTKKSKKPVRLELFIPLSAPGRTIAERTRHIIALGYAEASRGPDADPSPSELKKAAAFRIYKVQPTYHGTDRAEDKVTIEGDPDAIAAYLEIVDNL